MSLDFDQVAAQVEHMVSRIKAGEIDREQRLRYALDVLKSTDVDALKIKIERSVSTCTWLVAGIHDELNRIYDAIACPADYTAISTDGSHIDADRGQMLFDKHRFCQHVIWRAPKRFPCQSTGIVRERAVYGGQPVGAEKSC